MIPVPGKTEPVVSTLSDCAEMRGLVEEFVRELPGKAAVLSQLLRARQISELRRLAHQLRGSAGGYGFPSITLVAARVESEARVEGDVEALAAGVRDLCALCNRARAHL